MTKRTKPKIINVEPRQLIFKIVIDDIKAQDGREEYRVGHNGIVLIEKSSKEPGPVLLKIWKERLGQRWLAHELPLWKCQGVHYAEPKFEEKQDD